MPKQGKAKVLTEDEFNRTVAVQKAAKHGLRNVALLYCSFGLGLRAKELAQLSIHDVLSDKGSIKDTITLTSRHTKNGKSREVYLTNKKVVRALEAYVTTRQNLAPCRPLFRSQKNSRFSPNTLQMLFRRMYRAAGIDGASSHSGRRTFATRLIENGADIKAVSRLMGHSSIRMTAEYVQANPERLKRLASAAI